MPVEVTLYRIHGHTRSQKVVEAMALGIKKVGDRPVIRPSAVYRPDRGIVLFYGLVDRLTKAIPRQIAAGGTAIYVDLGYFGRRRGGRWSGYHKVVVNARHPNAYFQSRQHDGSRFRQLGVSLLPWARGAHVLVAGMGDKGSVAEGYEPGEWDREIVRKLKDVTDRKIIYRPKPSWKTARPIEGTVFSSHLQKVEEVIAGCHAVVTHHSNVAVEGLMGGIPAFCWDGVAAPMALTDLERMESPQRPEGRLQWAHDIAFTQWSVAEMAAGLPWRHLKDEGLVPC